MKSQQSRWWPLVAAMLVIANARAQSGTEMGAPEAGGPADAWGYSDEHEGREPDDWTWFGMGYERRMRDPDSVADADAQGTSHTGPGSGRGEHR